MNEETSIVIFTKSGESFTAEALARKLKGAVVELGETPKLDEDSAVEALAGFAVGEEFANTMDNDTLEKFIDEFCDAWNQE